MVLTPRHQIARNTLSPNRHTKPDPVIRCHQRIPEYRYIQYGTVQSVAGRLGTVCRSPVDPWSFQSIFIVYNTQQLQRYQTRILKVYRLRSSRILIVSIRTITDGRPIQRRSLHRDHIKGRASAHSSVKSRQSRRRKQNKREIFQREVFPKIQTPDTSVASYRTRISWAAAQHRR